MFCAVLRYMGALFRAFRCGRFHIPRFFCNFHKENTRDPKTATVKTKFLAKNAQNRQIAVFPHKNAFSLSRRCVSVVLGNFVARGAVAVFISRAFSLIFLRFLSGIRKRPQ